MENLFNTIFPLECLFCGKYGKMVCYNCLYACKVVEHGYCIVCGEFAVDGQTHYQCRKSYGSLSDISAAPSYLFSSFRYEGLVRECIRKSKYGAKEFAALKELSAEGAKIAYKCGLDYAGYTAVPIPLSRKKEKIRGFNQSLLIAEKLAEVFKLETAVTVLKRKKETRAQFGLSKEERQQNISGAFAAAKTAAGMKILLIDDICTSGSTLLEGSRVLYSAGAEEVRCYTLARKM